MIEQSEWIYLICAFILGLSLVVSAWLQNRCKHSWTDVDKKEWEEWTVAFGRRQRSRVHVRCEKCGEHKWFEVNS